jgi:hypothetical protein
MAEQPDRPDARRSGDDPGDALEPPPPEPASVRAAAHAPEQSDEQANEGKYVPI